MFPWVWRCMARSEQSPLVKRNTSNMIRRWAQGWIKGGVLKFRPNFNIKISIPEILWKKMCFKNEPKSFSSEEQWTKTLNSRHFCLFWFSFFELNFRTAYFKLWTYLSILNISSFFLKVGFIFNPALPKNSGQYSCTARYRGRSNEYGINLNVLMQTTYVGRILN